MSIPSVMIYTQRNKKALNWGPMRLAITPKTPITGATVRATLYAGRVAGSGGTPVSQINNLPLTDVGNGRYQGTMNDPDFAPAIGVEYTTVIDATGPVQGHWEIPSKVTLRST